MSSAGTFYVLHETAAGYALLDVIDLDESKARPEDFNAPRIIRDESKHPPTTRCVKLKAFVAFSSAEMALENINAISEHGVTEHLRAFLEMHLPKKKKKFSLGVIEPDLAKAISEMLGGCSCRSDDVVREVIRGARAHVSGKLVPELGGGVLEQSQLGLGHAFSRCKVKFNPARTDNMIIQSIGLLDCLDKDINTFAMRCREWYSWHFPELRDLVRDNYAFARAAAVVGDRASFCAAVDGEETAEAKMADLAAALTVGGSVDGAEAEATAKSVRQAARMSMGMDCSAADMANVMAFTKRMVALAGYRVQLALYLGDKMAAVAPNLCTLVGESVGARLISKAGSLSSLAKCPASTVQILGAEKALFRALKKKGNTPKYGLIYHSTFIGRAAKKNKGRISRYLANKCAMASRIDAFADDLTDNYGEQMREQVEERLKFFDSGQAPRRNVDVMAAVAKKLAKEKKKMAADNVADQGESSSTKKSKKKKRDDDEEDAGPSLLPEKTKKKKDDGPASSEKKKKKKKDKDAEADADTASSEKKKKKAKKSVE